MKNLSHKPFMILESIVVHSHCSKEEFTVLQSVWLYEQAQIEIERCVKNNNATIFTKEWPVQTIPSIPPLPSESRKQIAQEVHKSIRFWNHDSQTIEREQKS